MIVLPYSTHRAWLRSFWLVVCVFLGVLLGIMMALVISPIWFGLGLLAALGTFLPGMWWPHKVVDIPYRAWNKLACSFADVSLVVVTGIVFYIIFLIVGRSRTSLQLTHPVEAESGWIPRDTLAPAAYHAQYGVAAKGSSQKSWFHTYTSWAVQPGNLWVLSLVPFLMLLSALGTKKQINVPTDTYTLF